MLLLRPRASKGFRVQHTVVRHVIIVKWPLAKRRPGSMHRVDNAKNVSVDRTIRFGRLATIDK